MKDKAITGAVFTALAAAFLGAWILLFWIAEHTGFTVQTTPQYGFTSGVGTMFLTSMGMGGIVTTLWHAHNCHEEGCWRWGKHRVNGSPWCNVHHEKARTAVNTDDLLRQLIAQLKQDRLARLRQADNGPSRTTRPGQ